MTLHPILGGRFSPADADFTTQLLYASVKVGVNVGIADMGLNVLCDLIEYSAKIDGEALSGAKGGKARAPKIGIEGMTKLGRLRG